MENEEAIEGWDAISKMFRVHRATMMRRRKELMASGVIFYGRKKTSHGFSRVVRAFPSVLKAWQIQKSARGERV